eukprot:5543789-Prymnesium_polylepis.4
MAPPPRSYQTCATPPRVRRAPAAPAASPPVALLTYVQRRDTPPRLHLPLRLRLPASGPPSCRRDHAVG